MKTEETSPETLDAPTSCSRVANSAVDLTSFFEPEVQVVTWDRETDPRVEQFASEVLVKEQFEVRATMGGPQIESFDPIPEFARAEDPKAAELFAEDVRFLMQMFVDLTGAQTIGFRFSRLGSAMCPRFHADYVPVRLLLTYSGVGTEWLADEDIDRGFLGSLSGGLPDEESGLMKDNARVRHIPALSVALLKGKAWQGNGKKGAVHKSPEFPVGNHRILLSLDVID